MNITIETLPNYVIAFVRQVGPYGSENIQAMEKLKKWAMEKNLLTESSILLGIAQDNPQTTLPENCRYDACIVISSDSDMDDSIQTSEVYGGSYAIFKVKHTAEDIQKAWHDIFPAIHNSGYQIDNKPIFEKYIGNMLANDYCEICIPVKVL